jgi:uncharacterized SAM-binding protein YcdF (DUF218 family)
LASGEARYDYLIVFGAAIRPDGSPSGTLRRRIQTAFRSVEDLGQVRFLVTGGLVRNPPAEAVVMRRLLLELGASENQILIENQARNTRESALLCAAILRRQGDVGDVLVCSSRYHVPRCRMLLRLSGVRSRMGVGSEDAAAVGRGRIAYSVLREAAAMPLDAILLAVQRAWRGMGGPRH